MLTGSATLEETASYLEFYGTRVTAAPAPAPFHVSSLALGTHLGAMNQEDSNLYKESIHYALTHGINFLDTALNYRGMRSERDIGEVLTELACEGFKRSSMVISTKSGIIPGDIDAGLVPHDYLKEKLLSPGILMPSDLNISEDGWHVLAPSYYEYAINESRKHMNIETIDIHYIHNPELSMQVLGAEHFYEKLGVLLKAYEGFVAKGWIRYYGIAAWNAFTVDPEDPKYISLEKVLELARTAGGEAHHFCFIQTPFNRRLPYARTKASQTVHSKKLTLFEAAKVLGLFVTVSAPLDGGRSEKPEKILSDLAKDEQIFAVMTGMKRMEHTQENIRNLILEG